MPFNPEKLAKLIGTRTGGAPSQGPSTVRTGGKGTVRRKRKAVRKAANVDDKRLKSTLNRLNVRDIPAIEEVNLFKEDGNVIHFTNPKVQASIAANTYVISGHAETKKLQDLLPGIINQLGPDNLEHLKKVYASFASKSSGSKTGPSAAAAVTAAQDDAGDDDVPELVENFEEASKKTPMDFGPKVPAPEPAGGLGPNKKDGAPEEKKSAPAAPPAAAVAAKTDATKAAAAAATGGGHHGKQKQKEEEDEEDDGDDPDDPNATD